MDDIYNNQQHLNINENKSKVRAEIDPAFRNAYDKILEFKGNHDYKSAIKCCNEVLNISEEEHFLRLAAELYSMNENYGKEVSIYEKLTLKYPQKYEYMVYLAAAYGRRKWIRKSLDIYEELEKKSYESLMFYTLYIDLLNTYKPGEYTYNVIKKAIEYINSLGDNDKYSLDLIKLHIKSIVNIVNWCSHDNIPVDIEKISHDAKILNEMYKRYSDIYELEYLSPQLLDIIQHYPEIAEYTPDLLNILISDIECRDEYSSADLYTIFKISMLDVYKMNTDENLNDAVRRGAQDLYTYYYSKKIANSYNNRFLEANQYGLLETINEIKASIVDNWKEAKKTIAYIKEKYPLYYKALEDFPEEVEKADNGRALKKKYRSSHFPHMSSLS